MEKPIEYYKIRLEFIKTLFKNHKLSLLEQNAEKIRALVQGYNRFKNDKSYAPLLAEFPQVFIFN